MKTLRFLCVFGVLALSAVHQLRGQQPSPSPTSDPSASSAPQTPDDMVSIESSAVASNAEIEELYKKDRQEFLNKLKVEIEPNLIKGDIQKLNKNVMRLGSYRKDWAQAAEEFLVANSALAELYLYRYAALGNSRLNQAILKTLNRFQTLREPKAVLAFLHLFLSDSEQSVLAAILLNKMIDQSPQYVSEVIQVLNGPMGQKLSLETRLEIGSRACAKSSSQLTLIARETLKDWRTKASGFWSTVLGDELDNCLKSI
jgi:hypothetical protein